MSKRIAPETVLAASTASPASSTTAVLEPPAPVVEVSTGKTKTPGSPRKLRAFPATFAGKRFAALHDDDHTGNRQAELFYLQKQIQLQTQMVFVLEDGSQVQGIVEWYDRHSVKVRGKSRVLIYKSAIKYLYKAGEIGSAPDA